jgi:hypothetical protein
MAQPRNKARSRATGHRASMESRTKLPGRSVFCCFLARIYRPGLSLLLPPKKRDGFVNTEASRLLISQSGTVVLWFRDCMQKQDGLSSFLSYYLTMPTQANYLICLHLWESTQAEWGVGLYACNPRNQKAEVGRSKV